jgi:hypothetical protein
LLSNIDLLKANQYKYGRVARSSGTSCDIVRAMALSKVPCEERERLQKQFEDLRRAAIELESRLCAEIVSSDHSVKARAKNELERAEKRAFHVMMELTDHEKRHGCVNNEKPQKV